MNNERNEECDENTEVKPIHHSGALNSFMSKAKNKIVTHSKRLISPIGSSELLDGQTGTESDVPKSDSEASTVQGNMESSTRRSHLNEKNDPSNELNEVSISLAEGHAFSHERMHYLEQLIEFRRADWKYLKKMHQGSNYWLNVALLNERHKATKFGSRRKLQLYYLGLGLGRLIQDVKQAQNIPMEACQLLEELEFHFASHAVQGMKMLVASNAALHEAPDNNELKTSVARDLQEPIRSTIYKWNQRPVYRRLLTPAIPFDLDYGEVMVSVCEILGIVYSKLIEDNTSFENMYIFQGILRFDVKIKQLVIDPLKKEYFTLATQVVKKELSQVSRSNRSRLEVQPPDLAPDAEMQ